MKLRTMNKDSKIFVAGHRGLVGSSIVRRLEHEGYENIVTRTRQELDLMDQEAVESFFDYEQIDYVFDAAARVGGIHANDTYSAEFIYQNTQIQNNLIHNAWKSGVKKFLFLGSVCIYPKFAETPVQEESLMSGELEPTNDAYALAKIHGIYMLKSYYKQYGFKSVSLMPANLYGPNDNFHPMNGHVIPAMMQKFNNWAQGDDPVTCWGTGDPRREFLHVDDLADACLFAMEQYSQAELLNVGSGEDVSIKDLAEMMARVTGYPGEIRWDASKPDGTPKRPLDYSKLLEKGWSPKYKLLDGLRETYKWFTESTDIQTR
jgi:GDP-L-fucose synthase